MFSYEKGFHLYVHKHTYVRIMYYVCIVLLMLVWYVCRVPLKVLHPVCVTHTPLIQGISHCEKQKNEQIL